MGLGNEEAAREVLEKYKRKAAALGHMIDSLGLSDQRDKVLTLLCCVHPGPCERQHPEKTTTRGGYEEKEVSPGPCGLGPGRSGSAGAVAGRICTRSNGQPAASTLA